MDVPTEWITVKKFKRQNKDSHPQIPKGIAIYLIKKHSLGFYSNAEYIGKFFVFETAFYDYSDKYESKDKCIKKLTLWEFIYQIHELEPSLRNLVGHLSSRYKKWSDYKQALPTYGAAILSEDASYVVMVQATAGANPWGFPKGKINRHEDPVYCAIREIKEEIGFDIKDLIREDYFIENRDRHNKFLRLYIIEGIPMNTKFKPEGKGEVQAIDWKPIDEIKSNGGKIRINVISAALIDKLKKAKNDIVTKNLNET